MACIGVGRRGVVLFWKAFEGAAFFSEGEVGALPGIRAGRVEILSRVSRMSLKKVFGPFFKAIKGETRWRSGLRREQVKINCQLTWVRAPPLPRLH